MLFGHETPLIPAKPAAKPAWEQSHPCPNCGRTMQLSRSAAHSGGITGFNSYGCAECGLWTTESDEAAYIRRR
jgi:hypothetical protein